jgi:ABC-type bacteriocin/lantibiotic exporter with double-glycine peptidase domain
MRPRVLLFDEAKSALDKRTQGLVSESLDRLKVTRLVIAHRLSTIRRADRSVVLENGTVVKWANSKNLRERLDSSPERWRVSEREPWGRAWESGICDCPHVLLC